MSLDVGRYLGVIRLLLRRSQDRPALVYDLLSTTGYFADRTLFLNLGYWERARTLDEACEEMADLLARAADLQARHTVCDCGFGFADQDVFWANRYGVARILGVNITASQTVVAQRRVAAAGLANRIHLHVASATRLPFAAERFDKVLALETAFHYDTREAFFNEAFRILRRGGRLALTDILPLASAAAGEREPAGERLARTFWQMPAANMYPSSVYAEKLTQAGFGSIRIRSIGEHVLAPFAEFVQQQLRSPEVRKRMNPLIRWLWNVMTRPSGAEHDRDYVLVTADKPAS